MNNSYTDVTYANQLRALAECLERGENIPMISIIISLNEAAEKIDFLDEELQYAERYIKENNV